MSGGRGITIHREIWIVLERGQVPFKFWIPWDYTVYHQNLLDLPSLLFTPGFMNYYQVTNMYILPKPSSKYT
jgi:hypothetical protein